MANVDALIRRFCKVIATHCYTAYILTQRDIKPRPHACTLSTFYSSVTSRLKCHDIAFPTPPIFPTDFSLKLSQPVHNLYKRFFHLQFCHFLFYYYNLLTIPLVKTVLLRQKKYNWWCVSNYFGLVLHWVNTYPHNSSNPNFNFIFTSKIGESVFSLFTKI